ncbi:unnamed protein product [Camellia sinensis]
MSSQAKQQAHYPCPPHAVCIPCPAQGHINPMLKLAKLLHHKGFHITFINTEFNHRRLLKSQGRHSISGTPSFRFETIPDGLPSSELDATQDIPALCHSILHNFLNPFRVLLAKLNPPVTCVVSDVGMAFTVKVAEELGIPDVFFNTASASGFMGYMQYPKLMENGLTALKDLFEKIASRIPRKTIDQIKEHYEALVEDVEMIESGFVPLPDYEIIKNDGNGSTPTVQNKFNYQQRRKGGPWTKEEHGYTSYLTNGYLDTVIDWIPGMNVIRLKDLPSFIRTTEPSDIMIDFILDVAHNAHKASAIIFNTVDALEHDVLEGLSTMLPPIYTLSPLQSLLNQIPQNHLNTIGSSLWKEQHDCLPWLDSKEPNSVVYVNFGSITVMTSQQLIEFAWGLVNCKKTFLWVIRPDLVVGDSAILPPDFVNETKERGLLASWCPQEQVLNHPSVGGFLTHCGWNSTLESICSGVPMLCWLFFLHSNRQTVGSVAKSGYRDGDKQ